jgi:hypothetical protein
MVSGTTGVDFPLLDSSISRQSFVMTDLPTPVSPVKSTCVSCCVMIGVGAMLAYVIIETARYGEKAKLARNELQRKEIK